MQFTVNNKTLTLHFLMYEPTPNDDKNAKIVEGIGVFSWDNQILLGLKTPRDTLIVSPEVDSKYGVNDSYKTTNMTKDETVELITELEVRFGVHFYNLVLLESRRFLKNLIKNNPQPLKILKTNKYLYCSNEFREVREYLNTQTTFGKTHKMNELLLQLRD